MGPSKKYAKTAVFSQRDGFSTSCEEEGKGKNKEKSVRGKKSRLENLPSLPLSLPLSLQGSRSLLGLSGLQGKMETCSISILNHIICIKVIRKNTKRDHWDDPTFKNR